MDRCQVSLAKARYDAQNAVGMTATFGLSEMIITWLVRESDSL